CIQYGAGAMLLPPTTRLPMLPTILDLSTLRQFYAGGGTPLELVEEIIARCANWPDKAVFISPANAESLRNAARELVAAHPNPAALPLWGVPFAVKDNIDVAGFPTTAGCPEFAYEPQKDATVVERLRAAGAIVIGKTNLDQFATGLNGTRSPYGAPRSVFDDRYISGGSSSGSAVAVAAGLCSFSLGTDTAGSGRVPAALNNIVGIKPSLGLISTSGVVPACRTLDCVSVFALTVDDAWAALQVMAGHGPRDAYSRRRATGTLSAMPPHRRLGVPRQEARLFVG